MNPDFRVPPIGRRIISGEHDPSLAPDLGLRDTTPIEVPEIENPGREKSRILKRLIVLVGDHERSAQRVGIKLSQADLQSIFSALREHARTGIAPPLTARDEIHQYVLDSLFADLVEEPSNILYTTHTGPDTVRYDAMKPEFWAECLDLLEKTISQ
jgi:hypothetical protein